MCRNKSRFLVAQRITGFVGLFLAVTLAVRTGAASAEVLVKAMTGPNVLDGESPHLVITGLRPGEAATVHAFRRVGAYTAVAYVSTPVIAHAQARFVANKSGAIALDEATPVAGTYIGADPMGLLWSGVRMDPEGDASQPITHDLHLNNGADVVIRVQAPSLHEPWVETRIHLTDGSDGVEVESVSSAGLNGVFARPKRDATRPLPSILLLHGSEGGSAEAARETAIRFANLGYASLALNYFAWPNAKISEVPQALIDVPVEELAAARAWLMRQPGVDAAQVSLWGVSKGAEFALVGAAHYDWVDRVVACVPSSVVWSGFGRPPSPGEVYSSWSIAGKGLAYIPYDHYEDALNNKFSAAFVHQRSLDLATPEQRAAARIPIETTRAKLLLLAATNDVVWPSAPMARQVEATMRQAGKGDEVQVVVFPNASHYICGTGSEPRRINPVHKPEGNDPTPEADAYAAENSWKETEAFLERL